MLQEDRKKTERKQANKKCECHAVEGQRGMSLYTAETRTTVATEQNSKRRFE